MLTDFTLQIENTQTIKISILHSFKIIVILHIFIKTVLGQ